MADHTHTRDFSAGADWVEAANDALAAAAKRDASLASETQPLDLVWNIAGIAKVICRTPRQTYEALAKGELPARQVNGRWVASRRRLFAFFNDVGGAGQE